MKSYVKLDEWLEIQETTKFPPCLSGETKYPKKYADFSLVLKPIHKNVEKGAMVASATIAMNKIKETLKKNLDAEECRKVLKQLTESDPIAYLNNHGEEHVNKVIEKISEIITYSDSDFSLTPYEGFLLLCAIQIHDVGNVFGREEHEKKCREILEDKGKHLIPDALERRVIEKLALVHCGVYHDDQDTISHLSINKMIKEQYVRKKLLAALLRFGDELADDSTRADQEGLEMGTINENCVIYHRYSQALHTVKLEKIETGKTMIKLSYEFESEIASKTFKKNGQDYYLLDEIYIRTLKMERERRYCMRFLRPYIFIDGIQVEIIIQNVEDSFETDSIKYTLEESGYPNEPSSENIDFFKEDIRSGAEEHDYLKEKWGIK